MGGTARAQDSYEVQVYPSDTVPRGETMIEVHSNFTVSGRKTSENGILPTNHAVHETLEITHGFTGWFEVGFYTFTSAHSGTGWDWVGNHIRPRLAVPESWKWPVGLSLSQEFGYQRRSFSLDTWTWEIRPIVDKRVGAWYVSLNPALERSLAGEGRSKGFELSPNLEVTYDFTPRVNGALEYYGALGPLAGFDPLRQQQHQIVPAINLNLSPDWEFNFGVGVGMTRTTDHLLVKMILGYRFDR